MPVPHFQRYRLTLEPLTPIHIGTGEAIDPFDYSIDGDYLEAWDTNAVLSNLNDAQRQEFQRNLGRLDPTVMRKWLLDLPKNPAHRRFKVGISSAIQDELAQSIDNPRRKCEIHLLPRNEATGGVYLPGSSIKGAIRTALIDGLLDAPAASNHELLKFREDAQKSRYSSKPGQLFEAAVMGNLTDKRRANLYRDPLRQVAVSDIPLPSGTSFISKLQITKPGQTGSSEAGKILMYRELTYCGFTGQSDPQFALSADTELRLFPQLSDRKIMGTDKHGKPCEVPRSWTADQILQACRKFYTPRLLNEELPKFVTDKGCHDFLEKSVLEMENRSDQALVRIGRHSHFECVTVREPYRVPPPRGYGASRTFVSGKVPLGWTRLTLTPVTS
jgi:CRISPR-associated protein Csm5